MGTSGLDDADQSSISSSSSSAGVVNTTEGYNTASTGITTEGNNTASTGIGTWYGVRLPSPLSFLLDYSGRLRSRSSVGYSEPVINDNEAMAYEIRHDRQTSSLDSTAVTICSGRSDSSSGEVAIRISGAVGRNHNAGLGSVSSAFVNQSVDDDLMVSKNGMPVPDEDAEGSSGIVASERAPLASPSSSQASNISGQGDVGAVNGLDSNIRGLSSHESNDFQHLAKWLEQVLPFSLLLLVVFIRQHLPGFFVTIWVSIVMFKSNEMVKKQTALKGDRKVSVLLSISLVFLLHVMCIYWWSQDDDILYSPLILLPPKATPHFWHAIFVVLINDVLVRQAAMSFKCLLLIYFKNDRGHSFRLQAQILTLVEHTLLLYRTLLPTPVWYRFFLNREYGSLFSSLTTGLYLTFKLTSAVEKVQCFFSALKALWGKDILYGVYATKEQVNAAGDLCAICQEKMCGPILLRCKHIFCEECVSEWFDRERTCPLCRALVKAGDIRSFGDGSTSLFFQLC